MARSPNWTVDEVTLALKLYFDLPFSQINSKHPSAIELAKELGRTPSAVSFKLGNFGRLDPQLKARNISGLKHGSKLDEEVWNKYHNRREELKKRCEEIRSSHNLNISSPEIPDQESGLNFGVIDGKVRVVRVENENPEKIPLLRALYAPLIQAVKISVEQLERGNQPFGSLLDVIKEYQTTLDGDVSNLNYALVFSSGIRLKIAYEALRSRIEKGELPDLELENVLQVETILQLHGPFIFSSTIGSELVIASERYQRTPKQEREYLVSLRNLSEKVEFNTENIFGQDTVDALKNIGSIDANDPEFERQYIFGSRAAKNLTIVISATAVLGGVAFIPTAGPFLSIALGILSSNQTGPAVRELSDDARTRLQELREERFFDKFHSFFKSNKKLLSKISSGNGKEPGWFKAAAKLLSKTKTSTSLEKANKIQKPDIQIGKNVDCVVAEINSGGISVTINQDGNIQNGFIRKVELAVQKDQRKLENFKVGQTLRARIKDRNPTTNELELSIKAYERRQLKYAARKKRMKKR